MKDFTAGEEGFSVRRGGLRFPVFGQVPHPQAADPVVIEDPLNVMNNVGRSCFNFVQVQRLFNDAHAKIRHAAITLDVSPRSATAAAGGAAGPAADARDGAAQVESGATKQGLDSSGSGGGARGSTSNGSDDNDGGSDDRGGALSTEIADNPSAAPQKGEVAFRLLKLETAASRTGMLTVAMGGPGITPGSYWGGAYSPVKGAVKPVGSGIRAGFK